MGLADSPKAPDAFATRALTTKLIYFRALAEEIDAAQWVLVRAGSRSPSSSSALSAGPPAPKPPPGAKAEWLRLERAARKARTLALAYWIDGLVWSGKVKDLAAVARMCGVSRGRVSQIIRLPGLPLQDQEQLLDSASTS